MESGRPILSPENNTIKKLHSSVVARRLPIDDFFDDPIDMVECNVPDNGHCMFYAMILGSLLPAINDEKMFDEKFHRLFNIFFWDGEKIVNLRELLKSYNGDPKFIKQNESIFDELVRILRSRIVDFMREEVKAGNLAIDLALMGRYFEDVETENKIKESAQIAAYLDQQFNGKMESDDAQYAKVLQKQEDGKKLSAKEKTLLNKKSSPEKPTPKEEIIFDEHHEKNKDKVIAQYYQDMQGRAWGGDAELIIASRMLKANIFVYKTTNNEFHYGPVFENPEGDMKINLVYVNKSHYHFLVNQDVFKNLLPHNSLDDAGSTNEPFDAEQEKLNLSIDDHNQLTDEESNKEVTNKPENNLFNKDANPIQEDFSSQYKAQFEKQKKLRNRLFLLVVALAILLSPASLLFTVLLAVLFYRKNVKIKKLETNEVELNLVSENRNAWMKKLNEADKEKLSTVAPQVPIESKSTKRPVAYLVDKETYSCYEFFNHKKVKTDSEKIKKKALKSKVIVAEISNIPNKVKRV